MSKLLTPQRFTFKYPKCFVCHKDVDSYLMERDEIKGTITLVAKCHGREETRTFDEARIEQWEADTFFNDPKHYTLGGRDMRHKLPRTGPVDDQTLVNQIRARLPRQ